MKTSTTNRWVIVNRNTGQVRKTSRTRDIARINKRRNERIFDSLTGDFVR